ncbi:uncharacterized protein DNG_00610 [Cephalotrichum gorgonifer]|uniref:Uncharacterized protein n=1 Tax=Cephalotrichum gorgonifer TaxID=2041049 RepID=A0AAE8MQL8_9PEZI|nr:uncharacterized protein DNG_00610 [Cephalotrichum gorgonifer]
MSGNTADVLTAAAARGSPAANGRPPPPRFSRSISEIPPQPTRPYPYSLAPLADDRSGQPPQPFFTHGSQMSLDFSTGSRHGILSARSTPAGSRRASIMAAAVPPTDEALAGPSVGMQGSRKGSDEQKGDVERQHVAKTVTYGYPPPGHDPHSDLLSGACLYADLRYNTSRGLKQCIVDLSDLSSDTTRLLDDTYSSVLEKMGVLQSTILGLKELALQSQEVAETFEREVTEIRDETNAQISDFDNFQMQEERIGVLRRRVDVSRDKISSLGARVDVVRDMVEGWERADREWQERTRRRLMVVWGVTSAIISVLALLYLGAQYQGTGTGTESVTGIEPPDRIPGGDMGTLEEGILGTGGADLNSSWAGVAGMDVEAGVGEGQTFPNIGKTGGEGRGKDDRLRMFDEL